jgi:GT2 family glycosyltransferase
MNIAVLITCHNRKTKTLRCLKHLFNSELKKSYNLDVFLVDDGSSDGTSISVNKDYPQVNIIEADGSLFWGGGMRLAWEAAVKYKEFDYFLWLNDDANIYTNSINEMLEICANNNNEVIVVGSTIDPFKKRISYGGILKDKSLVIPNGNIQECNTFNGNVILVSSFVFKKLGYNNIYYTHYGGDKDYGFRAKSKSIKLLVSYDFIGECSAHYKVKECFDPEISILQRIRHLYTPLGNNPIQFFRLEFTYKSIFVAIFHFITIHIRSFSPSIWRILKNRL